MSDLDKAIRAALHQHSAALYEACDPSLSPWPDDPDGSTLRFSRTIRDLLDWANGLENGLDGPSAVGKAFAEQVRTVIATSLGVSGEDRSEPTPAPAPERQWAVEHPDVLLSVHRSGWSVLFTLSKLPGGRIVYRDAPDQPWTPETACLCVTVPDTGHYAGCPGTSAAVTPEGPA